jgi:hypothetical protein
MPHTIPPSTNEFSFFSTNSFHLARVHHHFLQTEKHFTTTTTTVTTNAASKSTRPRHLPAK